MKWGDEYPGDAICPRCVSSARWVNPLIPKHGYGSPQIGHENCPIVDTWWQTETGAHMITPSSWSYSLQAGNRHSSFFGIDAAIVDDRGKEVPHGEGGNSSSENHGQPCFAESGGTRAGSPTNIGRSQGSLFTGDGARRDKQGNFWIVGRIDDVLNVAGHRLGTSEVESALVSHPAVAEAGVVGRPDEIKGQGIVAFVTLRSGHEPGDDLKTKLRNHVAQSIGPIAKPDEIRFADMLPKTRSGKIMRRLLKQVAGGQSLTETLPLWKI